MLISKRFLGLGLSVVAAIALSACTAGGPKLGSVDAVETINQKMVQKSPEVILDGYASIAWDNYTDALKDAIALQNAIDEFVSNPNQAGFDASKAAWLKARESYGQSEIFRLSNGPIDAEEGWIADAYGALEGQLNAWPLDEAMIDYSIKANGRKTRGNIIDTIGDFTPSGDEASAVDITNITVEAITALNENGGEANVATGYHAIEFLLWGQDQDYKNFITDRVTKGALVAGQRPLKDFTSDRFAKRRQAYLQVVAQKIVEDLELVRSAWSKDISSNCAIDVAGCYRGAFVGQLKGQDADKNIATSDALKQVFAGMGVFIKSELANERIAVSVLTPSEEDEHSCFSDNTHRDIATNYQGFKNLLLGSYKGKKYGLSMFDALDATSKARIVALMDSIESKIASIDAVANSSRHFDYQIKPTDPQSKVIVALKNELRKLGDQMVGVSKANGIDLNVNDVTDSEETKI